MKPKTMMLMVVAIGCGLVASYMTSRLLAERSGPPQTMKKILVAVKKVPQYTPIKEPEKFFVEKDVPEDAAPKKALTTFEELRGKKLNKAINEEAYVYADDLLDPNTEGMHSKLAPGQRAVAIKVDAQSLAGGFVLPGTHVDVVCTQRRGENDSESKIILQNMLVLAVDTKNNREDGQSTILGQTVTLAAKPEEAQQLSLASSIGELKLILRALGDEKIDPVRSARINQLGQQRFDPAPGSEPTATVAAATPVPAVLPPLPAKVEAPAEEPKPEPEAKPVKTHTLTIYEGEYVSKHVFVWDDKEGWKRNVTKSSLEAHAAPRREPAPAPVTTTAPAAKPQTSQSPPTQPTQPAPETVRGGAKSKVAR